MTRRLLLAWAPVIAFEALVLYLSTRSHLQIGGIPYMDKAAHFVEYAAFGSLIHRAVRLTGSSRRGALALTLLLVAALAGFDEVLQSSVPGRDSNIRDWAADLAGAACGVLVVRWLEARLGGRWLRAVAGGSEKREEAA